MDNSISVAREILESYDEITIDSEITRGFFLVSLMNKQFLFMAPEENDSSSRACFCLINDDGASFPHIMLREEKIPDVEGLPEGKYRWICLYEHESIVNSIVSYEDKIVDAIDRLLELLSMSEVEREHEFQKEFMYYWNSRTVGTSLFDIYLEQEENFSKFDVYHGGNKVRLIEQTVSLSDIGVREKNERKWIRHLENEAYYIPIVDCREILPPHCGYDWNASNVENIIYPKQIEHINDYTFQQINTVVPKTQNIILVFGMRTEKSNVVFAVRLKCKNSKGHTILEKVLQDIIEVQILHTTRRDYLFLNEQIGNDIGLYNKNILVVGAGSLGSYVAFELVKNGASQINIYDGDRLEDANVLRWAYGGIGKGSNKASVIGLLLELLHPEIHVEANERNIDEEKLIEESKKVDLIIFTIGSSDEQLKYNRALKAAKCTATVIYVWLEAGGHYSHILVVDYEKEGCYECLYTDKKGRLVNNRATKNSESIINTTVIRNGCGGTRAAYGTSVLLRTVSVLLNTIQKIQYQEILSNTLIDIAEDNIKNSDLEFPMEACGCCGIKSK